MLSEFYGRRISSQGRYQVVQFEDMDEQGEIIECDEKFYLDKRYRFEKFCKSTRVNYNPVGNGATSVVVQARDELKNRKVAIKKIKNIFSDRDAARRALRELRIQRSLHDHPNVS